MPPSRERKERASGPPVLQRLTEKHTVSIMPFQESHPEHWQAYKRHRLALVLLFLTWIPAVRLGDVIQTHLHLGEVFGIAVPVVWIILIFLEGLRVASWPCPSCGKIFRGLSPILPRQCAHCHTPR